MGYSPGLPAHEPSQRLKDAVRACKLGTKCGGRKPNSPWFDFRERHVLRTAHRSARSDCAQCDMLTGSQARTPECDGTAADPSRVPLGTEELVRLRTLEPHCLMLTYG